jgi:hypothetical protein
MAKIIVVKHPYNVLSACAHHDPPVIFIKDGIFSKPYSNLDVQHLQEFPIFSSQNMLFANSLNRHGETKNSSSPIVYHFYSKK